MRNPPALVTLAGLLVATVPAVSSAADLEAQVVGPIAEKTKYVVSPRGVHLATVAPKGSRVSVIVDGEAGPRFDEIVETSWGAIDPRPYAKIEANSQPQGGPVTFSRDGNHYAYVGRLGQEWVLMVDNKEKLRLPAGGPVGAVAGLAGNAGNTDLRMEFTGEKGAHLVFARSSYNGYELWFDGQKWPGFYSSGGGGSEGTVDPVISRDGEHVAYVAQLDREKRGVVVDGKVVNYFGVNLQFTPDSKHLVCMNQGPAGQAVLLDGKQLFSARQIQNVFVPPAGNRFIFSLVHFNQAGNAAEGSFLLVDGKPVEATLTPEQYAAKVIFSPDGKHYAAICGKTGNQFVVVDGKKGQEYFTVQPDEVVNLATGIAFSADGSKLGYVATTRTGSFVVINDEESDAVQAAWFRFSADGKRVAYGGRIAQGQKSLLVIDGKPVSIPPGWSVDSFTFSPDGAHYAFNGQQGGNKGVFLDGKNTEITGDFAFSPDGNHFAVLGAGTKEAKTGLFVDGQLVYETYSTPISYRGFTPDGQHLFWMAREPASGAKAAPGAMEIVVYIDGHPAGRCDDMGAAQDVLRRLYGPQIGSLWKMPNAWNANAAGKLIFLGPVDEGICRFTATPVADANIDTMIATAKDRGANPKPAAAANAPTGRPAVRGQAAPPAGAAAHTANNGAAHAPATPATPDPANEAAAAAKARVDAAAAKTKAWLEGLTKKK